MLSKTPLRLILIVPFVAQITAAVGLTAWLSIRNGQKAVHDVAIQLLDEVSTLTRDRIPTYLKTPQQLNAIHANDVELGHIDIRGDVRSISPLLVQSLQIFEPVSFTVFASPRGHYIGARREADGRLQIGVIDDATNGDLQYYSTNEQGDFLELLQDIDVPPGDVLKRPWYEAAVAAQASAWSEVYTTRSTESLAITAARPVYSDRGDLLGVFSTTISLEQIDQFLKSITIGQSGQVFIVDGAGRLIATSTGERLYRVVNRNGEETKELLQVTKSQNRLTRATADALRDQVGHLAAVDTAQNFELVANREREFVKVTPLSEYAELDWRIVVVAPEADFMAQIYASTRNTVWLCLGALVLATGSSILTARWITRPLLQLNQATKDITQGSLQSAQFPGAIAMGHTREVSELSRSFSQMTRQLQNSFAALQTSEANFRNMAANVPGAIFRYLLRPDGTDALLYMSPGCYQLWEIEAHRVEQDASLLWDVIDPEDVPATKASVIESARTLETWNWEWRITTPSGRRKWLQSKGQPTRQPDGSVLWHTVILDVSDRKAAEEALKVQRDFNELIANITSRFVDFSPANLDAEIERALQDIAEVTGIDTSYIFKLDEAAQTFSMSHEWCQPDYPRQIEQAQDIPFADFPWSIATLQRQEPIYAAQLVDLPEAAAVDCAHWQTFNIVAILIIPLVQRSEVTGFMGFASFSQPIIWEEEIIRLLKVMGQTIANAQESNRVQSALIDSEARWQFALTGSGQGVWDWDLQTNQVEWNEIHFELLGLPPETSKAGYKTWRERIHPDDVENVEIAIRTALETQTTFAAEYRILHPDGSLRWLAGRGRALYNEAGQPTRMIGVLLDITARKLAEQSLRENEQRFVTLAQAAPVSIFQLNAAQECTYVNARWSEMTDQPAEVALDMGWVETLHPDDRNRLMREWLQWVQSASQQGVYQNEGRVLRSDGSACWYYVQALPLIDGDIVTGYIGTLTDITDRKQAEVQLQDLTNRLELAARSAHMGIWEWNIVNDRLIWDDRMYELYGVRPEDFSGSVEAWETGVHPDDQAASRTAIQQALSGERDFDTEFRVLWPDGTVRYIEAHAIVQRDMEGRPLRMIGVNWDISDRKQAEEQLIYSALHDTLTDLPNRTLLTNRLESSIQRAQRSHTYHFAVLFLDLDQFKVINDSLGHLVGDQLLLTLARKLQSIVRPTDLAARLGGDEFVILIEHIPDIQAVIHMAERLLAEFNSSTSIDGHSVFVTTSIGIVWGTRAYTEASDLLRDADIALYRAKAKGRGRYEIFDVEMHIQAVKRMRLERDLRIAVDQQEFITYYQPIVDLNTQQITGFEALIRWQHPVRGFISPADFIPVAEETGLIVLISQWVLQSACEQVATWQRQFPNMEDLRISINLSGQDLRQPALVETIQQTLTQAQLPAASLTLEITESMLIDDIEMTINLLEQLRDLGIRISIDDFGTGYSSLSYLYNLPADYLKIDQSFVGKMQPGNKNYKIVQAVVSLSDQLELAAIAEGIETTQQLDWLKELGCELGQGYLLSRPLHPEAVATLLSMGRIIKGCR